MMGLTPRQLQLLRFITGYRAANGGVSPDVRECMRGLGLYSSSGIVRLLRGLEERGAIRRLPMRARAIEVLERPAIPMINNSPLYAVPMVGMRTTAFSGERV